LSPLAGACAGGTIAPMGISARLTTNGGHDMYHPSHRNAVRERIIAAEVKKLEWRQARERAAHRESLATARDVRVALTERRN
jgi:hypothetical protein